MREAAEVDPDRFGELYSRLDAAKITAHAAYTVLRRINGERPAANVSMQVDPDVAAALDACAMARGISRAKLCALIVTAAVKRVDEVDRERPAALRSIIPRPRQGWSQGTASAPVLPPALRRQS